MGRAPCCDKNGLKKGPWTPEEDQKLVDYIQKNGYGNWRTLPKNAGLQRCGKSCRLRWTNYLRPDIKRGRFTFEEEETIIQLHSILGNKWSAIAARLPGRTDNEIKNYWNTHIRKRLLRMGIDPVTHSPRLDLLDLPSIFRNTPLFNTCSPPPQMNMSRLLPLVNPELIKLATTLMSSSQPQDPCSSFNNQDFTTMQNNINHPIMQTSNQIQAPIPNCTTMTTTTSSSPCLPFLGETHLMNPNFEQYPQNIFNLDEQNFDQWQTSNGLSSHGLVNIDQQPTNFSYYDSDNNNTFFDPSNSNSNSNSNSTYVNSNVTEDERDQSYCSDMIKFEIPDILDVTQFLLSQEQLLMKGS